MVEAPSASVGKAAQCGLTRISARGVGWRALTAKHEQCMPGVFALSVFARGAKLWCIIVQGADRLLCGGANVLCAARFGVCA